METQRLRRIVVATDLSQQARAVVDVAVTVGRVFDAALDLVHVREPLVYTLPEGFVPADDRSARLVDQIDQELAALADRVTHQGLPCVTSSLDGVAHLELLRHAQRTGAGLIVLGVHEHGTLVHAMLGSVAERVMHKAGCPVLVVPMN